MKYTDILQYSDFIIIPFEYSDISTKSTLDSGIAEKQYARHPSLNDYRRLIPSLM